MGGVIGSGGGKWTLHRCRRTDYRLGDYVLGSRGCTGVIMWKDFIHRLVRKGDKFWETTEE